MSVVTWITSKPIPSRRKRADCFEWWRAGGAAGRCNASINFTLEEEEEEEEEEELHRNRPSSNSRFKLKIRVSISIRTSDVITFRLGSRDERVRINLTEFRTFQFSKWMDKAWSGFRFSTWHETNFFNSENYIIGQLRGGVGGKRSRWRMIESCARVGNFIVLLEPRGIYLTS